MGTMTTITLDEYDFPTSFECQNVEEQVHSVTLEYFYDLAFQKPENADAVNDTQNLARAYVEGSLLQQMAAYYGLWDGVACEKQLTDDVWFVGLSSLDESGRPDIPNPDLSSCYELQPTTDEICVSFQGIMTGQVVGLDNTLDTIALIARQMNADAVTLSTYWIRVKFLGVQIDTGVGRENLPPAKNVMASSFTTPDNKSFTVIGVLIVAGITMAVLGLVFVIARKRRSKTAQAPFEHQEFEDEVKSSSGSDTKPVEDEDGHDEQRRSVERYEDEDTLPETPYEFSREYNFDLGGWMKSELLGIHGETAITAQPSKAEEALSDSDNDSWAQTEGTIGSLELRLDPIEAEV